MAKAKPHPPLLFPAPKWQPPISRRITLWHGCVDSDRLNMEAKGIDLRRCNADTDFGRGFYVTTIRRQAEQWAWRRHFDLGCASPPVVLRFRLQRRDLASLDTLPFVLADYSSEGYWSLVQHCRQSTPGAPPSVTASINNHDGPHKGWYDLVTGPVAAMWRQRVAMAGSDQFSFHTRRAITLLNHCVGSGSATQYTHFVVR